LPTVENVDVTDIVGGHLNYNKKLPDVLRLLNINSSVIQSFSHRAYQEGPEIQSFKNRITDFCLANLDEVTLAHEELERVRREEAKREKSLKNKFSSDDSQVSSSSPVYSQPATVSAAPNLPSVPERDAAHGHSSSLYGNHPVSVSNLPSVPERDSAHGHSSSLYKF
jgi:hypothetical protein